MPAYVALLRGINVGGKNLLRMPALVSCFESIGYSGVRTYLQSGNVLFESRSLKAAAAERRIEAAIADQFGLTVPVVLRSREQMAEIVAHAPADHGDEANRSDVFFIKQPLTAEQAFDQLPELREGVDSVALGPGVIYFSRVAALASRTRITKMMSMPVYQSMTIRNWNTTTRVAALLDSM